MRLKEIFTNSIGLGILGSLSAGSAYGAIATYQTEPVLASGMAVVGFGTAAMGIYDAYQNFTGTAPKDSNFYKQTTENIFGLDL